MFFLYQVFSSETLKMKRTLALWLSLLTPGALVFLEIAASSQQKDNWIPADANPWLWIFEHMFSIWGILILPLFITLETALLGQVEYSADTWKLILTQPVPRWTIIMAKQIWNIILVELGMVALIGLMAVGGSLLSTIKPEMDITVPFPFLEMLRQSSIAFLTAGLILAIHTWIALRFNSFVLSSSIGILMTIGGIILQGLAWVDYFPWSMPSASLYSYYNGETILPYLLIGGVGGFALSFLSNWQLTTKEIK